MILNIKDIDKRTNDEQGPKWDVYSAVCIFTQMAPSANIERCIVARFMELSEVNKLFMVGQQKSSNEVKMIEENQNDCKASKEYDMSFSDQRWKVADKFQWRIETTNIILHFLHWLNIGIGAKGSSL